MGSSIEKGFLTVIEGSIQGVGRLYERVYSTVPRKSISYRTADYLKHIALVFTFILWH